MRGIDAFALRACDGYLQIKLKKLNVCGPSIKCSLFFTYCIRQPIFNVFVLASNISYLKFRKKHVASVYSVIAKCSDASYIAAVWVIGRFSCMCVVTGNSFFLVTVTFKFTTRFVSFCIFYYVLLWFVVTISALSIPSSIAHGQVDICITAPQWLLVTLLLVTGYYPSFGRTPWQLM